MKLFRKILYVSEPSVAQGPAIARALSLAENNQADLTLLEVVPVIAPGGALPAGAPTAAELRSALAGARRAELESLVAPLAKGREIRIEVLAGRKFLEAVRAVLRDGFDLLIKPAENPAFLERVFGSDDMHLLRACPCPVWLTGPDEKAEYARILAAVDFEPDDPSDAPQQALNAQILELASSLALSDFAALHIAHVWDAPAEMMIRAWTEKPNEAAIAYVEGERARHERALNRLRDGLRERVGEEAYGYLSPRLHLKRGAAATVIPATAAQVQADLVVMGTVARTGIAGLLIGNTAETILEQLHCSVLAVKPPGFVSPIRLSE